MKLGLVCEVKLVGKQRLIYKTILSACTIEKRRGKNGGNPVDLENRLRKQEWRRYADGPRADVLMHRLLKVAHEAFHQDCCVGTVAEPRLQFRYFSINLSRYSLTNETKINTSGADCAK